MTFQEVYRIVTFIPPDRLEGLLEGVARVAPLRYGNYDCAAWWSAEGVEQFRPLPGSNPSVGHALEVSRVSSIRVEFAIPRDRALLDRVLSRGLLPSHPFEEPAVFIDECVITLSQAEPARLDQLSSAEPAKE